MLVQLTKLEAQVHARATTDYIRTKTLKHVTNRSKHACRIVLKMIVLKYYAFLHNREIIAAAVDLSFDVQEYPAHACHHPVPLTMSSISQ